MKASEEALTLGYHKINQSLSRVVEWDKKIIPNPGKRRKCDVRYLQSTGASESSN
jgi:hypothetical protein